MISSGSKDSEKPLVLDDEADESGVKPGVLCSSLTDYRGFKLSKNGTAIGVGGGARDTESAPPEPISPGQRARIEDVLARSADGPRGRLVAATNECAAGGSGLQTVPPEVGRIIDDDNANPPHRETTNIPRSPDAPSENPRREVRGLPAFHEEQWFEVEPPPAEAETRARGADPKQVDTIPGLRARRRRARQVVIGAAALAVVVFGLAGAAFVFLKGGGDEAPPARGTAVKSAPVAAAAVTSAGEPRVMVPITSLPARPVMAPSAEPVPTTVPVAATAKATGVAAPNPRPNKVTTGTTNGATGPAERPAPNGGPAGEPPSAPPPNGPAIPVAASSDPLPNPASQAPPPGFYDLNGAR